MFERGNSVITCFNSDHQIYFSFLEVFIWVFVGHYVNRHKNNYIFNLKSIMISLYLICWDWLKDLNYNQIKLMLKWIFWLHERKKGEEKEILS